MSNAERMRRPAAFQRVQYPCVVLPSGDRWQVLYTGIDRPYTVGLFASREDALQDADVRNDEAYFEQQAFYAAKTLIESIKDRVLAEERVVARRARWRFLRFLRVAWWTAQGSNL